MKDEQASEQWIVLWFPPDSDRTRIFKSESRARQFAQEADVACWNPLIEWRRVTTITESRLLDFGSAIEPHKAVDQ